MTPHWQAIVAAVEAIPPGRVASYGQIAALAGLPGRARLVGRVLASVPEPDAVPWHRVVNARGALSLSGAAGEDQRRRLANEGVELDANGRINLRRFGLVGDGRSS